MFDEICERYLPFLIFVRSQLFKTGWLQAQFTSHLYVSVTKSITFSRINPFLQFLWNLAHEQQTNSRAAPKSCIDLYMNTLLDS